MGFGLLWFTIPAERGSSPSDRVIATTAKKGTQSRSVLQSDLPHRL